MLWGYCTSVVKECEEGNQGNCGGLQLLTERYYICYMGHKVIEVYYMSESCKNYEVSNVYCYEDQHESIDRLGNILDQSIKTMLVPLPSNTKRGEKTNVPDCVTVESKKE